MAEAIIKLDVAGVIDRLEANRPNEPFGLAFDADGTLWSGDVGEDVFFHAIENRLFKEVAQDAFREVARQYGVVGRSAAELAGAMFEGYRAGTVPERHICEVMTWCYAGMTTAEVTALARDALEERGLLGRVRPLLGPILEWARRRDALAVVISASPEAVVKEGLRQARLSFDGLAAGLARIEGGVIQPQMAAPLPYGPSKRLAGLALLSGRDWLGSFADNVFDFDMLEAARVGVAVCPKPALTTRLFALPNTVVLE